MERAIAAGIDEVAVFLSTTESFSQRNINCSIAESFDRAAAVIHLADAHGIRVRGYVSCVLGCPYERDVPLRSEEHTSELQSLMRSSYAVFCLKKKKTTVEPNLCFKQNSHIN